MLLIILMYIYRVLINALSAYIIHIINLNVIFYTHVEHSSIKNNLHKVLYRNTHTHTHPHPHTLTHTHIHTFTHTHTHSHSNEFECA